MSGPHLWEIRAVRDVAVIALALAFLWLLVRVQSATLPVLIGFGLAYLVDPILKEAQARLGVSRKFSIAFLLLALLGVTIGFSSVLVPLVLDEGGSLLKKLPRYVTILRDEYGLSIPLVGETIEGATKDPKKIADLLRPALSWVGGFVGSTTYTLIATVLTLAVFAFSAWNYESLPGFQRYFPKSRRARWSEILGKIERVFSGFIRGQLVVAMFTGTIFGVGFYVVGVPYWFLAAGVGGVFSIIPYGQASGWILAVGLSLLEAEAADPGEAVDWVGILVGPTIVYALMQSMETFVITPLVQGSSTKLHPVAVLAAVVAGGSLGGIVGVFLAIPFVASGKILLQDVVLPRIRRWADEN